MHKLFVKNVGELVTCASKDGLGILQNGAVTIEGGQITAVGKTDELTPEGTGWKVIDAEGKPVLPGFIDAHTHFPFGGYRADEFKWRLQGITYEEIMEKGGGIVNTVKATREINFSELKRLSAQRLDSMMTYGVTTVEGKSGYGLNLETELKQLRVMKELQEEHPLDIAITFLGAHATPPEYKNDPDGYIDYLINDMLPQVAETGMPEFCDVFCDKGAFNINQSRRVLHQAQKLGLSSKIHADEIASIGGAELAADVGAISADHLLKISDEGIKRMKEEGVVGVLLPITAFSLKKEYAPARKLIDAGVPVALATDFNPGSCYSESIPLLIALSTLYMNMTIEETILGLTKNAAAAIDREDQIGSIEKGKQGDLVILDAPSYTHLAYHISINSVDKVIKKGKLLIE